VASTRSNLALPTKRHTVVRAVRCAWRSLTGGPTTPDSARHTLIACSGGADSCALALALASTLGATIAHIVHDFRGRDAAMADHDAVRDLAAALGTPFVSAQITCRAHPGNLESVGRRLRYAALADLAAQNHCTYVATAHHADDQLETMLMRLARGAGPAGLAGIPPRRRLVPGIQLIRPMLALTREACQQLCIDTGWVWQEDTTNTDITRVRAALRARVIPAFKSIRPDIASRAADAAALQRSAAGVIAETADAIWAQATISESSANWPRELLAATPPIVLGELFRLAHGHLAGTGRLDQLSSKSVQPIIRAIRGSAGQERAWTIGKLTIQLTRRSVVLAACPA
jgi:tRNA(Ile)-lysidine synthase